MSVVIRDAELADIESITEIYNEAIDNSVATFDTEPKSIENRKQWLQSHREAGYPVIVADTGTVVGWACLTEWSDRCAYARTAETSIYISSATRGAGIGTQLLAELMRRAREIGLHTLLARISDHNPASLRIHEKHGFQVVGIMKEVGQKFGRLIDVHLLQVIINEN